MNRGLKLLKSVYKQPLACTFSTKLSSELVVFMDDDMVVCWHPEPAFPYEYTKPIPLKEPVPQSVLKIGEAEVKKMFRPKKDDLIPEELAKLTYTCKHRWFPRARDKKAKNTPPNRKYL